MSITTGARRRLVVLDSSACNGEQPVQPGEIVCLVRNTNTEADRWTPVHEASYWSLDREPRTNRSRAVCWDGWLGAHGTHSRDAHGAYRVVSVSGHDARYAQGAAADWTVVSLVKVENP